MSYAYLFKYIIIGDTGQFHYERLGSLISNFDIHLLLTQGLESLVCSCSSLTRGSNLFMT